MNKDDGEYLLEVYQHCKDFRKFFLGSDYQSVFNSLLEILKDKVDIDNICGLFLRSNHECYDFYSVIPDKMVSEVIDSYQELIDDDMIDEVQLKLNHVFVQNYNIDMVALESSNIHYGYLYFLRNIDKNPFDNQEIDFLNQLGKTYCDIFRNKDTYQRKVFNQSSIGQILNNIKANVFITNPHTDEVLYLNNQIKESYKIENGIGEKCWKLFPPYQGHHCDDCPNDKLLSHPDQCFVREQNDNIRGKIYQNYDSLIEWFDHSLVHFQYSLDITELRQFQNDASFDELTGIYNRRSGKREMTHQLLLAKNEHKDIVVCLFDLDYLKTINDTYGHQLGDFFIKSIADVVKVHLNENDIFFRLSGDEFIVSFYDTSIHLVNKLMMNILKELKIKRIEENIPFQLSYCFGSYTVPSDNTLSLNDIMTHVDEKMYFWKKRNHLLQANEELKTHSMIADEFDYDKSLLYDALVKSTDDYLFICNLKKNIFKYPPAMVEEFAFPSEILTNAVAIFGAKIHEDDKYEFLNSNQQIIDGRTDSHIVEYRALNKNNEYVWLRCNGHVEYDENNEPALFAGFISNLGKKNYRDSLTGLFNNFEFEKRIGETTGHFAIMILNMSDFKSINQLYDRDFGDSLLRIVGQNLQTLLHKETTLFKLDGAEFGLILKNYSNDDLVTIFQKIQVYTEAKHSYEGRPFTCQFNAGAACSPQHGESYLELRKNCEIALQHSKRHAHHQLTIFNNELLEEKTYTLQLINTLKQNINHYFENFSLVFQPKVASHSHYLMGFEALCRWNHPDFPNVGPATFIPLLEESGDIVILGNWIFEQSVIQLKEWLVHNQNIVMSINVSYIQLIEDNFIDFVEDVISHYEVPPHQIIIELTETAIAKNTDMAILSIKRLRNLGIQIAMDDFGKGYSSLSLLKDEPLDIIKIDQSFVRDINADPYNYAFMKFIIELCHQIQLKVVVEGVETKEELDIVEKFNPDYIQGYYTGKPQLTRDIMALIFKKSIDN